MHTLKRRNAFTLVELLVALTIIAILGALSFAAFRATMARSNSTKCVNNLHQLGLGLQMFAADNKNHVPGYGVDFLHRYMQRLAPYVGVANPANAYTEPVFHCPLVEPGRYKDPSDASYNVGEGIYGMPNSSLAYLGPAHQDLGISLLTVSNLSKKVFLADKCYLPGSGSGGSSLAIDGPYPLSVGGACGQSQNGRGSKKRTNWKLQLSVS